MSDMKNIKRHLKISFGLLILSFIPRILWDYYQLPHRYIPWIGSVVCAIYFLLALSQGARQNKIENRKKDELKEQLLRISDDATLEDGDTIDDYAVVCDVEELERVLTALKEMPEGKRKLQTAFLTVLDQEN